MSLDILNPFGTDAIPENVATSLDAAALIVRFNPSGIYAGHFMATGRSDGVVCIYDFETKNVIRVLEGHVKAITAVCWSRKCRFLMSASRDWNIIIWDLETGDRRNTVRFDAPVTSAALHPRNSHLLVATLQNQAETMLVDLRPDGGRWELLMQAGTNGDEDAIPKGGRRKEFATVVRFTPKGDLIFVGSSLGSLFIFDTGRRSCVHHEVICPNASIKMMEFDPKGIALVTNSSDRIIRVFGIDTISGTLTLNHKFQDLVGRNPWSGIGFSKDGEYVSAGAGAGNKAAHAIHVWDRTTGALLKILEGPKDPTEDLDWHPTRPFLATVSDLGVVHIWANQVPERWAAYAPGFEELSENKEYIEAEDEFDIVDAQTKQQREAEEQNAFVDILTLDDARVGPLDEPGLIGDDLEDTQDDFVPTLEDDDMLVFKDNGPPPAVQPYEQVWDSETASFRDRGTPDMTGLTEEEMLQLALAKIDEEEGRRKTRRKTAATNGKR